MNSFLFLLVTAPAAWASHQWHRAVGESVDLYCADDENALNGTSLVAWCRVTGVVCQDILSLDQTSWALSQAGAGLQANLNSLPLTIEPRGLLRLQTLGLIDAGEYRCRKVAPHAQALGSHALLVYDFAVSVSGPSSVAVGTTATWNCTWQTTWGSPLVVTWSIHDKSETSTALAVLTSSGAVNKQSNNNQVADMITRTNASFALGESQLMVEDVQLSDATSLGCAVTYLNASGANELQFAVNASPGSLSLNQSPRRVLPGKSVSLHCELAHAGQPAAVLRWEMELTNGSRVPADQQQLVPVTLSSGKNQHDTGEYSKWTAIEVLKAEEAEQLRFFCILEHASGNQESVTAINLKTRDANAVTVGIVVCVIVAIECVILMIYFYCKSVKKNKLSPESSEASKL